MRRALDAADQVAPAEDEEGEPWPPPTALCAVIKNYGDPYDGILVEVGPWLPRFGYFECRATQQVDQYTRADEPLLLSPHELEPMNEHTKDFVDDAQEAAVEVYDDAVYELRDLLDSIGIAVKAESVACWAATQRHRIEAWAKAVTEYQRVTGVKDGKHPTLPTPPEVA